MKYNRHKYFIYLFILLSIDQISKFFFQIYFKVEQTVNPNKLFGLTYKTNSGFIFGIGESFKYTVLIATLLTITLILPSFYLAFRFCELKYQKDKLSNIASLLFFSGVLGNLLDRIMLGYSRDFIIWPGPGNPNIADIFITIGLVLFMLNYPEFFFTSIFNKKSIKKNVQNIIEYLLYTKNEVKKFWFIITQSISRKESV